MASRPEGGQPPQPIPSTERAGGIPPGIQAPTAGRPATAFIDSQSGGITPTMDTVKLPVRPDSPTRVSDRIPTPSRTLLQPRSEVHLPRRDFCPKNIGTAQVSEVFYDNTAAPGTKEFIENQQGKFGETLTQINDAGESLTITAVVNNGDVSAFVTGGPNAFGPIDSAGKRDSGIVEGGRGEAGQTATLVEAVNEACTTWATIRVVYNPDTAESKGSQNLTDALLTGENAQCVITTRLTPISPQTIEDVKTGAEITFMESTLRKNFSGEAEKAQDRAQKTIAELSAAETQGLMATVIAVGIPGEATETNTQEHLSRIAGKVASANPSDKPYKFEVVRNDSGQIISSPTIEEALSLIPGETSLAPTSFIAAAIEPIPRIEAGHVRFVEGNPFDYVDEEKKRSGRRIEIGTITRRDNREGGAIDFLLENLILGTLVVGQPGLGKSEIIARLVEGGASYGITSMILATQKGEDFYKLAARFKEQWEREHPPEFFRLDPSDILASGEFVNVFHPMPGMSLHEWAIVLAEKSAEGYSGGSKGKKLFKSILQAAIETAYEHCKFEVDKQSDFYKKGTEYRWPDWEMVLQNAVDITARVIERENSELTIEVQQYLSGINEQRKTDSPPELVVIDPFDLKSEKVGLNVFRPPKGTTIIEQTETIVEIFAAGYDGDEEGRKQLQILLKAAILEAYKERGYHAELNCSIYEGGYDRLPDWTLVREKLQEQYTKKIKMIGKFTEGQIPSTEYLTNMRIYLDGIIEDFTQGSARHFLNPSEDQEIDPARLLEVHSLFNLEKFSGPAKSFTAQMLTEIVTKTRRELLKEQNPRPGEVEKAILPYIIVNDEAWDVFAKKAREEDNPAAARLKKILHAGRAANIGMILGTQILSNVIPEIGKLTRNKIVLQVDDREDRETLAKTMGVDDTTPRGQAMLNRMGYLGTETAVTGIGNAVVRFPSHDHPLMINITNPAGKSEDNTQIAPSGRIAFEQPPTYKQDARVENWLALADEPVRLLKAWAAITYLMEARGGGQPTIANIPERVMTYYRKLAPEIMQALLKKVAANSSDDRGPFSLEFIVPGDPESSDFIPNTRHGMRNRIIQNIHNTIYKPDAAQLETLAILKRMIEENPEIKRKAIQNAAQLKAEGKLPEWIDEKMTIDEVQRMLSAYPLARPLPKVPGNFTMTPYQYDGIINELDELMNNDPTNAKNIIQNAAQLKAEGKLPEWIDEKMSLEEARRKLWDYQLQEITRVTGKKGPGRMYFGISASRDGKEVEDGSYLEQAMGVRWHDPDAPAKFGELVDKFVSDPLLAARMKEEVTAFLEERVREKRKIQLEKAQTTLESWIATTNGQDTPYPYRQVFKDDGLELEGTTPRELLAEIATKLSQLDIKTQEDSATSIDGSHEVPLLSTESPQQGQQLPTTLGDVSAEFENVSEMLSLATSIAERLHTEEEIIWNALFGKRDNFDEIVNKSLTKGRVILLLKYLKDPYAPVNLEAVVDLFITPDTVNELTQTEIIEQEAKTEILEGLRKSVTAQLSIVAKDGSLEKYVKAHEAIMINAEKIAEKYGKSIEDVFRDDELYKEAYRDSQGGELKIYIQNQRKYGHSFVSNSEGFLEMFDDSTGRKIKGIDKDARSKEFMRIIAETTARRMWGEEAINNLPSDLRNWLLSAESTSSE